MNAYKHRAGAALTLMVATAIDEWRKTGQISANPLLAAAGGYAFGTLPDIFEPAFHPNHRRFFHSVTFGSMVGRTLYDLYQWQPQDEFEQFLRGLGLVVGGAYLVHLVMDSTTPKSLPWV